VEAVSMIMAGVHTALEIHVYCLSPKVDNSPCVPEFPAIYGTLNLITAIIRTRH
jgi:hypothetical protein